MTRDKKSDQEDVDSGQTHSFFHLALETRNLKFNSNFQMSMFPLIIMLKYFDFTHWFEMDEGVFHSKHEEIRVVTEKELANFRMSGQGNDMKSNERSDEDDSFERTDNSPGKVVSK